MGRKLIVLSDGTGNSTGRLYGTNVWRFYQALDLSGSDQIARYDNGVGTSKFKPLAILGGAVGWGLKRNLLDLYTFLSRNYQPGDDIYCFGFSRGAFTVRVLSKFVLSEGFVTDFSSQDDLRWKAKYLYRRFRSKRTTKSRLEFIGRLIRDVTVFLWTAVSQGTILKPPQTIHPSTIRFVGVWDTVDAYGLPIRELKQGIDKYLWPLALEDRELQPEIQKACHALSIDDQRRTFHPLLWDESDDKELAADTDHERLSQVWFSGVHSNIGGGYPEDGLSYISLAWMIMEAQKNGLRFHPAAVSSIKSTASPYARMYNSRAAFGAYYRYAPRDLNPPVDDQGATILHPKIHHTVILRILFGADAYAPLNLPENLRIVADGGDAAPTSGTLSFEQYCDALNASDDVQHGTTEVHGAKEQHAQVDVSMISRPRPDVLALIWDTVWRRRVVYFATLGLSLTLLIFPFFPSLDGAIKVLSVPVVTFFMPIISMFWFLPDFLQPAYFAHILYRFALAVTEPAKAILPSIARPWIDAFLLYPFSFLYLGFSIAALLYFGSLLDRRIQDRALAAWNLRWRTARHVWFLKSDKSRIAAIILAICALAFFVGIFLIRVRSCYLWNPYRAESLSLMACAVQEFESVTKYGENSTGGYEYEGLERILRVAVVAFLVISLAVVLLWAVYRVHLAKGLRHTQTEVPGFSLWISRRIRTCRVCIIAYMWVLKEAIPLTSAVTILIVTLWIAARSSFFLVDNSGWLCQRASSRFELSPDQSMKIEPTLDKLCESTGIWLLPGGEYKIELDYWDDYTDIETDIRNDRVYQSAENYVPVSLRKASANMSYTWTPFRRVLSAPWFAMIARVGIDQQIALTSKTTRLDPPAPGGFLYLFVNDATLALPFAYDVFYRHNVGTAKITIRGTKNVAPAPPEAPLRPLPPPPPPHIPPDRRMPPM
jgi:uncharacterized protein (DUF2235 family)